MRGRLSIVLYVAFFRSIWRYNWNDWNLKLMESQEGPIIFYVARLGRVGLLFLREKRLMGKEWSKTRGNGNQIILTDYSRLRSSGWRMGNCKEKFLDICCGVVVFCKKEWGRGHYPAPLFATSIFLIFPLIWTQQMGFILSRCDAPVYEQWWRIWRPGLQDNTQDLLQSASLWHYEAFWQMVHNEFSYWLHWKA